MKKLPILVPLALALGVIVPPAARSELPDAAEIPPHIYTGRIIDSNAGNLATSSRQAEVRARKGDGTLLARSQVRAVDGTPANYALHIPMNLSEAPGSAVQGERLTFEVDDGQQTYLVGNAFPAVGKPGRVSRVDLVAGTDANANGFADEFERDLAAYMSVMGIDGPLTRNGDLDGDGVSNYDEYLAGTDLLSSDDFLRIALFGQVTEGPDIFELGFLPGLNRTYSLQASTNLTAGVGFQTIPYRGQPAGEAPLRQLLQSGPEYAGPAFLYLIREDQASGFYRLTLE